MAQYKSAYTGEEIDLALGRSMPNGELDEKIKVLQSKLEANDEGDELTALTLNERITREVDALNESITKLEGKISESSSSSLEDCLTRFNADGSITQTFSDRTSTTAFNADGSITEQIVSTDGTVITKTTTFNEDGSISEEVS